jgi:hypothetical protein
VKQRLLYLVLVFSLAVNAGVLGFYGVSKYRDWRQSQRFHWYLSKVFKPGTTVHQVDRLFDDLKKSRSPYWDTADAATREIGLLALEPNPDSARLNAALDRIARATREEHRLVYVWWPAFHGLLRPEKLELRRNRFKVEYDSILQADSATAVQPKEGR